jgi:hypothetical protein
MVLNGRPPTVADVADVLDVEPEAGRQALQVCRLQSVESLSPRDGETSGLTSERVDETGYESIAVVWREKGTAHRPRRGRQWRGRGCARPGSGSGPSVSRGKGHERSGPSAPAAVPRGAPASRGFATTCCPASLSLRPWSLESVRRRAPEPQERRDTRAAVFSRRSHAFDGTPKLARLAANWPEELEDRCPPRAVDGLASAVRAWAVGVAPGGKPRHAPASVPECECRSDSPRRAHGPRRRPAGPSARRASSLASRRRHGGPGPSGLLVRRSRVRTGAAGP